MEHLPVVYVSCSHFKIQNKAVSVASCLCTVGKTPFMLDGSNFFLPSARRREFISASSSSWYCFIGFVTLTSLLLFLLDKIRFFIRSVGCSKSPYIIFPECGEVGHRLCQRVADEPPRLTGSMPGRPFSLYNPSTSS